MLRIPNHPRLGLLLLGVAVIGMGLRPLLRGNVDYVGLAGSMVFAPFVVLLGVILLCVAVWGREDLLGAKGWRPNRRK